MITFEMLSDPLLHASEELNFNVRGTAVRDKSKNVRCGTHWNIVMELVQQFSPRHVLEHGMGFTSTFGFFELPCVETLTSIEDDVRWCNEIARERAVRKLQDRVVHQAISYATWSTNKAALRSFDLVLVDGGGVQRPFVLDWYMQKGVRIIVEHDAESWSKRGLELRRSMCDEYGYDCTQRFELSPETAVFVKR